MATASKPSFHSRRSRDANGSKFGLFQPGEPEQSSTLSDVAGEIGATPMQVALAWLLHGAPPTFS
jgi:aryl-alcohol dehydrogenase-like predicted oxidoreductase